MHFGFSRICVSVTSMVLVDSLFKHLSVNNVYYEAVMVRGVVRWHVSVPSAAVAWAVEGSPPSPPIGSPAWPMLPSYWSSHRLTLPLFRGNLASQDSRGIRRGSELN